MRFHVIGLPHTEVDSKYSWCAYTQKVRLIVYMLLQSGYETILYAGKEYSQIVKGPEAQVHLPTWDPSDICWVQMAMRVTKKIIQNCKADVSSVGKHGELTRTSTGAEIILLITPAQMPIYEEVKKSVPNAVAVEYGVGYASTLARYCVFESTSHRHFVYGRRGDPDGSTCHTVIQNSFDPTYLRHGGCSQRPLCMVKGCERLKCAGATTREYVLYIGRLVRRKGILQAVACAKRAGVRLVVAGEGEDKHLLTEFCEDLGYTDSVDIVGLVTPEVRQALYQNAIATVVLTQYVGPFEGVHAESMMCGTPVITSNWGVFTETVQNGVNGWRVDSSGEFVSALDWARKLSFSERCVISDEAHKLYSVDSDAVDRDGSPICARLKYVNYFRRVEELEEEGRTWATLPVRSAGAMIEKTDGETIKRARIE